MPYGMEQAAVTPVTAAPLPGSSAVPMERRRDERAATVFTIGKISFDGRSLPCMVRDLSAGGMRIQLPAPPPPSSRVLIEMRGLDPRLAHIRWVSGHEAGLSFDLRCCPADIFAARSSQAGRIARQPRFPFRRDLALTVGDSILSVRIDNISVGGVLLAAPGPLDLGLRGILGLALGDRQGIAGDICWSRNASCGFRFVQPISSVALAVMLNAASLT
ncbi:PilZ domain-containing protein [Sphingobium sp. HWE2-09]|uniref:PilZ domain-containing protein n=1 Tax=Sphingobium sp. HWE2-09 TaxID=3108390 RepID=UPI002DC5D5F4|nr:PilZ domain-containing protein [Sphingobium sp. HWE2-09]